MDKPWQVIAVGLLALLLFVALILKPEWAYILASGFLLLMFSAGFLYQPKASYFILTLPGIENPEERPQMSGHVLGSTYPEEYVFRVDVKNLWVLGVIAFIPVTTLLWFTSGGTKLTLHGFPPYELTVLPVYVFGAVWVVMRRWIQERRILRDPWVTWAGLGRAGCGVPYQFLDQNRERRGGLMQSRHLAIEPNDTIAIVFSELKNPDQSRLSCDFLFHTFRLVDVRHGAVPLIEKLAANCTDEQ